MTATSPISLVFSANLNTNTVNTNNFTLVKDADASAVTCTVAYADATKTVTITPSTSLAATSKYILTVDTDVKDTAGNTLASTYTSYFTTT